MKILEDLYELSYQEIIDMLSEFITSAYITYVDIGDYPTPAIPGCVKRKKFMNNCLTFTWGQDELKYSVGVEVDFQKEFDKLMVDL